MRRPSLAEREAYWQRETPVVSAMVQRYIAARKERDAQQQPKPTQCPWDAWKSVRDLA